MVELTRFFERELDDALRTRREDHLLLNGLAAAADDGFDFLPHLGEVYAERLEHFGREALALRDDTEQNMLGADIIIAEALGFFLRQYDGAARAFGERFPH